MRWRPSTIALTGVIALPFAAAFLLVESKAAAYALYAVPSFFGLIYASISYAAMQELVPPRMRSMASAVMLLCLTLLGIGLGPVIVGVLSDAFAADLGARSIAHALLCLLVLNVCSVGFYLLAAKHYRGDLVRARSLSVTAVD